MLFQSKMSRAALAAATVMALGAPALADDGFTLADIPEIENKEPIHVALEAGGAADLIIPYLQKFSEATGVPVTSESMVFATIYSKEVVELQGGTGAYDVVVTETSWTNEWRDYLFPLNELAEAYDPEGVAGLRAVADGIDPGLLRMASTRDGVLVGIPYYTYTMISIYREDLFNDAGEQAAFKEKFGYDLAPATEWQQLLDQAQFFTRKSGETLRGETLDHDFYGVSMMAGRFPHVQDELAAMIWSKGAHWASPVREDGKLTGFTITDKDRETLEWAFTLYQELMKYAPPGSENAFWDFATAQFVEGNTAIIPLMYNGLWNWASSVANEVPGARAAAAPVVGSRPYTGAFHFAPSRDSGNPEAAYWLLKYIGSFATQKEMIEGGWAGTNIDVLSEPDKTVETDYAAYGWIPPTLAQWEVQTPDVDDYLHFNSSAFGKIYEQMTIIGHENATGVTTPAESVEAWEKAFSRLQRKFGELPVQ
ncbi:MAG: extracellular solute-binding protein [Rhodospirillales bacterium]